MAGDLYYGDNLDVLRRHIPSDSVDLVYLDPPFNSNANYNVLFEARDGSRSAAQIQAFEDTWRWDSEAVAAYKSMVEFGGPIAQGMEALRTLLGETDMLAYLSMMAPRLVELHRVLKPGGQIYLHCDTTAGHYLKVLLDCIFGGGNFMNEIVWHYQTSSGSPKLTLIRNHDLIYRYAKSPRKEVTWNAPKEPWPETTLKKWQKDEEGRIYREQKKYNKRYYIDPEGKLMDDVWNITLASRSAERLGYPTQKPLALLERIIRASSNPGDTVLDPFCGCGTAIDAAQMLDRKWIGIDITHLAVNLMRHRMRDRYGAELDFNVYGEPTDIDGAFELAANDAYGFQLWALGLVGARPAEIKKGADKGVDGRLYFFDGPQRSGASQIVFSVKGGKLQAQHVRDLRGVIEREKATMGVLITAYPPSKPQLQEAVSAGTWRSEWTGRDHPRMEIITIEELINGREINYPHVAGSDATLRRAQRYVEPGEEHPALF